MASSRSVSICGGAQATPRGKRRGPPFVMLGGAVRYAMSDVLEFERAGLRKPLPRQVAPDDPTPPEVIQNLTVRDVVAVLSDIIN